MEISYRSPEPFIYQPYSGPRHVPDADVEVEEESVEEATAKGWVLPVLGAGYAPGKKVLKETGFFAIRGFTGWMRRDEARTTGYGFYKGERWAQPNFQRIAAWGRVTGNKPDAPWALQDSFAFRDRVEVSAPRNDSEFRELAAMFDRAYAIKPAAPTPSLH